MAALHSVRHYHYIFTTRSNMGESLNVSKFEAHVFALCREEADFLFNKEAPMVHVMLGVEDKGVARHFMIAGKRYNSSKSYVASIGSYVEPMESRSRTPFTDFISLYRSTIADCPLLSFKKQLWEHKAHHIPTPEQLEILADETGEYVERIKSLAMREFYAYSVGKAITQYGRPAIQKIVGDVDNLELAERGFLDDDVMDNLKRAIPNFGVVRHYKMSVGDLLFFYDMMNGTFSSHDIYSGEKKITDFPKKVLRHLCTIDSRFAELAAQEI